MINKKKMERRG